MKLKFKLMAAAVALAASAGAHAAITVETGTTVVGELFFTIYDVGTDTSSNADDRAYVRDLGSLLNGGNITNWGSVATSPQVTLAADKQGFGTIYSIGADAGLSSFLAASTDTSRLQWNIAAFDTYGTDRVLTTAPSIVDPGQYTGFRNLGTTAGVYLAAINPFLTGESAVLSGADASISLWGDNMAGRTTTTPMSFTTTAGLGNSLNFYMLSEKVASLSPTTAVTQQQYMADANTAMQWTLGNDGNLSYGAVAAIPEPSEYALMLAGLGMLGFMARRRLNNRA